MDDGPKIEWVAVGVAGEAVVDLAGEMDREAWAGRGVTAGDRAGAAKLGTSTLGGLKAEQVQDLGHRDLPANLVVVDARHGGLVGRVA